MDLKNNTKESVQSRLKQSASKIWGYQESDTEGFDPVIDLLFGACASEFERLSTEVYSSQKRILEKVSQILLPEVFLCPVPSYAVMHGKPVNAARFSEQMDQFIFEKETQINSSDKPEMKKIFFSPIPGFRLIKAEVQVLATSHELIKVSDVFKRESQFKSESYKFPHKNQIWFGLQTDPAIDNLFEVSFYFDWLNHPDRDNLIKLLRLSKWSVNGEVISVKSGYNGEIEQRYASVTADINSYLDFNIKIEKKVCQFFENQFITINADVLPVRSKYPEEFKDFFLKDDLAKLKQELCWISVEFPEIFPTSSLSSTYISPTAFPVINRRLHDSNRPYTLSKDLNIIPVISDDYFLAIRNIISSNHINYQEVPFKRVSDFAPGTFTVRTEGIKRFDERNAHDHVQYLLELLREEYVAFKSMGSSMIEKELNDLQVILNRLRLNVLKSKDAKDPMSFVIMKSELVEDVWLEFWSTNGDFGNSIATGTITVNPEFDKKSLKLVTATTGGKNPPDQVERISLFKKELLTRNRIVTMEDIKMACFAELGNELDKVEISHRPVLSKNRNNGFQNCLHVTLNFKNEKSDNEKANLVNHMWKTLEQKSSCIYKYHVEAS